MELAEIKKTEFKPLHTPQLANHLHSTYNRKSIQLEQSAANLLNMLVTKEIPVLEGDSGHNGNNNILDEK